MTEALAGHLKLRSIFPSRGAGMACGQTPHRAFAGIAASLFAGSVALTIIRCRSMPAMRGMPMPGGWTMSTMWMRMPGQTWSGAAVSFVSMWLVMMAAMMLPSFAPMLWRYRLAVFETRETRLGSLTALVSLGYFLAWTVIGIVLFPLGAALASSEMKLPALARAVPVTVALVVLLAGALQFTAWKAYHLACCRKATGRGGTLPADAGTAWRQGVGFALHCSLSCANLTAIFLAAGVMNLRAMTAVTAAITAERLAPTGEPVARVIGAISVGAGLFMLARTAGLG